MADKNEFIEQKIVAAIQGLLARQVNELLQKYNFSAPPIQFGDFDSRAHVVSPEILLSPCEETDKEEAERLSTYYLSVSFLFPKTREKGLYCFAYSDAVRKVVNENPTLDGAAESAVIIKTKFIMPSKFDCGENYDLVVTLQITVSKPSPAA